jgi:hypothetical protein
MSFKPQSPQSFPIDAAIAKQVEWAMPETFKTHIVRLGGFHTLSCFIASIGKLWGAKFSKFF